MNDQDDLRRKAIELQAVRDQGDEFIALIQSLGRMNGDAGREFALAKTKIQEAVMWACAGLTKELKDG